jgi:hypothetical protein
VINREDLVEENPQEAPYLSLEDNEFIEYFFTTPQEENDDEESSHG